MGIVNDAFTPEVEQELLDIFGELSERPLPPMPEGAQVKPMIPTESGCTAGRHLVLANGQEAYISQRKDGTAIVKTRGLTFGFKTLNEGILGTALFLDRIAR